MLCKIFYIILEKYNFIVKIIIIIKHGFAFSVNLLKLNFEFFFIDFSSKPDFFSMLAGDAHRTSGAGATRAYHGRRIRAERADGPTVHG